MAIPPSYIGRNFLYDKKQDLYTHYNINSCKVNEIKAFSGIYSLQKSFATEQFFAIKQQDRGMIIQFRHYIMRLTTVTGKANRRHPYGKRII
jgi:hypothetical protein